MKPFVREFETMFSKKKIPEFSSGDTLRVSLRVREGEKERTQIFEGVVIQIRGDGINKTVTIRKISGNVAVERIFPLHSPIVADIELVRRGDVRRSRLFYLRKLLGKAARIKEDKAGLSKAIIVDQVEDKNASEAKAESNSDKKPE